ncbi:NAD-P-binding protein [Trametes meyenii]|nr:NAD-P-binding protein [Trametes meyenii]
MSPGRYSVFLLGYIGGGVLARLLSNAKPLFDITVLLRDAVKADKLKPFGVKSVLGTLDDTEKIGSLASQADLVFECVLTDNAAGQYDTDIIYNDNDAEQLAQLPAEQPHRVIDLTVIAADQEGYVKTYIVLPSTIYGLATGPLVDAGITNPQSQQIPALILAGIDRGQAGMVGEGKNIWPNVHIDDVVHLYEGLWNTILTGKQSIGHGKEGYYFGENGEHKLYDVARTIGAVFKDFGLSESDEPTTFTKEELDKYFYGSESLGSNSRCRAERSRAAGWKPKKRTEDMLASIKPEIQYMLSRVP